MLLSIFVSFRFSFFFFFYLSLSVIKTTHCIAICECVGCVVCAVMNGIVMWPLLLFHHHIIIIIYLLYIIILCQRRNIWKVTGQYSLICVLLCYCGQYENHFTACGPIEQYKKLFEWRQKKNVIGFCCVCFRLKGPWTKRKRVFEGNK